MKKKKNYVRTLSEKAREDIAGIPWIAGLTGAVAAPLIALITKFSEPHAILEMILISVGGAFIAIAGEFLIRFFFAIPKIHKEQTLEIDALNKQIEEAKTPKISIEKVNCRKSVGGDCSCRVTIRNLSKMIKVENVCVRMSGDDVYGVFVQGYDPFHESDLLPATGNRDINPDSTADFIFPDTFNQLVGHINWQPRVIQASAAGKPKPKGKQTFKLAASSSGSVTVQEEFVIVEDQQPYDQILIEKVK